MSRLPVVFVSHGAPTHALEAGAAGLAWEALGRQLPRPQAILAISPHWDTEAPMVSAAERPGTIHDFHGFPEPLYEIRYPAPGAPALASRVTTLLEAAGLHTAVHPNRGLDHGAWVPLRRMYPDADIPVTQLSTQFRKGPAHHYAMGRALAPLAQEGVLVFATGGITHNLRDFFNDLSPGQVAPYVNAFRHWMLERMLDGDIEALLDYRHRAPSAARAHPQDDHLMPLYVALGAADGAPPVHVHDSVDRGVMAMDIYTFG
jgi:4,5-DOPA dioxygenase extradiol